MPKVSDAHREERRHQILDGARRAFARHGYEGATVSRLEQETGLSRGAIFSYFPNKWELFFALASEDQRDIGALWLEQGFEGVVRRIGNEDPEWVGVYLEVARLLRTSPERREQWMARNPDLQAGLVEQLTKRRAEGLDRDDIDIEAVGNFLGVVLDGLAVHLGAGYPVDVEGTLALVRSALQPK
jgi:TetR/AcrR family transcriptional regulator, transcriptional repressor of aconitase